MFEESASWIEHSVCFFCFVDNRMQNHLASWNKEKSYKILKTVFSKKQSCALTMFEFCVFCFSPLPHDQMVHDLHFRRVYTIERKRFQSHLCTQITYHHPLFCKTLTVWLNTSYLLVFGSFPGSESLKSKCFQGCFEKVENEKNQCAEKALKTNRRAKEVRAEGINVLTLGEETRQHTDIYDMC